jgi:hypothetical protein
MRHAKWGVILLVLLLAIGTASLVGGATTPASGQNAQGTGGPICGAITSTVVIVRDAWLACDVQCLQTLGPCVAFGRPSIKFSLNGFKMTGPANEPSRNQCSAAAEFGQEMDGVHSKFDEVQIVGPGVIQRMKRHGIGLVGTQADPLEKAQVKQVISHMNCFSGIFMFWTNETLVNEVVSVKNSANGQMRPCGGICVTNSSRNTVRRSEVAGNGTTDLGPPPAAIPNDFGIGLVGGSNGNLIEENAVGGNINGLALFPAFGFTPTNNRITKNIFAGNPPTEVFDKFGPEAGSDIRDFAGAVAGNTFKENLCLTYTVGTGLSPVAPAPCAGSQHDPATATQRKVPPFAGHQNN